jgi:hypothetical protein
MWPEMLVSVSLKQIWEEIHYILINNVGHLIN